jgi:hypothetical protein
VSSAVTAAASTIASPVRGQVARSSSPSRARAVGNVHAPPQRTTSGAPTAVWIDTFAAGDASLGIGSLSGPGMPGTRHGYRLVPLDRSYVSAAGPP